MALLAMMVVFVSSFFVGKALMHDDGRPAPPWVRDISTRLITDDDHGTHFGHLPEFATRDKRITWSYRRIAVPGDRLTCATADIGARDGRGGLRADLRLGDDLRGIRLGYLVTRIREILGADHDLALLPCVRRLVELMKIGRSGIYDLSAPMMLEPAGERVWVRDGNCRYLALLLLGAQIVEGFDWTRIARQGLQH